MLLSSVVICSLLTGSVKPSYPSSQPVVGVLWSAVAMTELTRHTLRLATRKPS